MAAPSSSPALGRHTAGAAATSCGLLLFILGGCLWLPSWSAASVTLAVQTRSFLPVAPMASSTHTGLLQRSRVPAALSAAPAVKVVGVPQPAVSSWAVASAGRRQKIALNAKRDDEDRLEVVEEDIFSAVDWPALRAIVIFPLVLGAFFGFGFLLTGLLLPFLLGDGDLSVLGTWEYWFKF
eukprot:EG_transcript_27052